jgi:hypothetical protein
MALVAPLLSGSAAHAQDAALLKFVNNTGAIVRFYVDGEASCSASAGEYCNDSTTVGDHTLYSRYEDPNYQPSTACDAQTVSVPADGFTWTCS